jgi:hypothetical protein
MDRDFTQHHKRKHSEVRPSLLGEDVLDCRDAFNREEQERSRKEIPRIARSVPWRFSALPIQVVGNWQRNNCSNH